MCVAPLVVALRTDTLLFSFVQLVFAFNLRPAAAAAAADLTSKVSAVMMLPNGFCHKLKRFVKRICNHGNHDH